MAYVAIRCDELTAQLTAADRRLDCSTIALVDLAASRPVR